MFDPAFTITPAILSNVEQAARILGFLQGVYLPDSWRLELAAEVTAEMVHASTAIEGNTLTREQVTRVLRGERVQAVERDVREVRNYYETLLHIRAVAASTERFTHQTIKELHHRLLRGVDERIAGRYRTGLVRVGDYTPPEPFAVQPLMDDFIAWLNRPTPDGLSPLLYAGIAHYQLVVIHPFEDGNGRTARALTTLYLLRAGYDISESFALESYYNRERARYYAALHSADVAQAADGRADLTGWLEYFTAGIVVEAARTESRVAAFLQSKPPPHAPRRLSATQQVILDIAGNRPAARMGDFRAELGLSRSALNLAARRLVEWGLLAQEGEKRGRVYRITAAGREHLSSCR
jgi:Fic family protein